MSELHLDDLLRGIERPSRYIGQEVGLPPRPGGAIAPRLRVALGFPDVYEVGMSHHGYRLLHAALLACPDLLVERVFLPWPDLQRRLQQESLPLCSLESRLPLAELDLLGLSVQYELALPGVLRLLDLAGIPRRSAARAASGERWPFVLMGGAVALNPEPLAPFVDGVFLGEADEALPEIVEVLASTRGAPRAEVIARLAGIEGMYLPELVRVRYDPRGLAARAEASPPARLPVRRRYVENLDSLEPPAAALVPFCAPVHDRVTVEIQRGCSRGCRFCQAGFVSRPTRQRSVANVLQIARAQLAATGYQDLGLLSLSAGDHPALQQILTALIAEHGPAHVALSLPSMRSESLHPLVAAAIASVRKTGFTIAPEAATDRLRRVINKLNSDDDLIAAVRSVIRLGYTGIKLYFMIGLPGETDDDVLAISSLAQRVLGEAQQQRRSAGITVSVSTFVPKPHTPFQWEAAPPAEEVRRKLRLLQGTMPRRVRLRWHEPGQSLVEAYLSRADRRMAGVIERVASADGIGLESWTDYFGLARWEHALAEAQAAGELPPLPLLLQQRDPALPLPWDHLDVGVTRAYLERERAAALAGRTRADCTGGECDACGVCPAGEPLHRLRPSAGETAGPVEGPLDERAASVAEGVTAARAGGQPGCAPAAGSARPRAASEAAHGYRLWFRKEGRASLIAHLELVNVFERAARRARLPLAFSGGHHPKPRLRFSPALPLGAESRCELVELRLSAPQTVEAVLRSISRQLPPGLVVERCEPAGGDELIGRLRGIRWQLHLPGALPAGWLEDARARLAAGPLIVERPGGREVDLSAYLLALELDEHRYCLTALCRFDERGTVKPAELLRGLLRLDAEQALRARIVRAGWLFDSSGSADE